MRTLFAVLALVVLALAWARMGFREERASLGFRLGWSSSAYFLFVGYLLGPRGVNLLTPTVLEALTPVVVLGLGWIGLAYGAQFNREVLTGFTIRELAGVAGQALVAFALLAAAGLLTYEAVAEPDALGRALVLAGAAAACVSTPTGLGVVFGAVDASGPVSRLLSLATSLDGAVGIALLSTVLAMNHPPSLPVPPGGAGLLWLAIEVALGVFYGWLFRVLTKGELESTEFLLFLLGLALVAAGTSTLFSLSALLACSITGAMVANRSVLRRRAREVLARWEKPVYLVFLLLAGALLQFPGWIVLPLVAGYVLVRAGSKFAGGMVLGRVLSADDRRSDLGLGLSAQGGISIAMAVSVYHVVGHAHPDAAAVDLFFTTVVVGVLVSELSGPALIRGVLERAGEIQPDRGRAAREIRRRS
ncbi:MAG: cation:proton antiporter [Gemmatimonadota bacterium]